MCGKACTLSEVHKSNRLCFLCPFRSNAVLDSHHKAGKLANGSLALKDWGQGEKKSPPGSFKRIGYIDVKTERLWRHTSVPEGAF